MDGLQALASPSSISTFAGDLAATLPLEYMPICLESPIVSTQQRQIHGPHSHGRNSDPLRDGDNGDVAILSNPDHSHDTPVLRVEGYLSGTSLYNQSSPSVMLSESPNSDDLDSESEETRSSFDALPITLYPSPNRMVRFVFPIPPPSRVERHPRAYYRNYSNAELRSGLLKLPPELHGMILHYVLKSSSGSQGTRKDLSRLSLVCRKWSFMLRAKLFRRLELTSMDHVHFLVDMLRQQRNGWLAGAIRILLLRLPLSKSKAHMDLERILPLLSRKLPLLQELFYFPATHITETFGPHLQLHLRCYTNLRKLTLLRVKVSRFSLLVQLLGSLQSLEIFRGYHISWAHTDPTDRRPARMAPFLHLKRIHVESEETTTLHMFLWLFSPMVLRRCGLTNSNIESRDTVLLMLAELVSRGPNKPNGVKVSYYSGSGRLVFKSYNGYNPEYTVTFGPSIISDKMYMGIHRVVISIKRWESIFDFGAEWEDMDRMFAQEAVGLKLFEIVFPYQSKRDAGTAEASLNRVRSHFPRLTERGVMSARL